MTRPHGTRAKYVVDKCRCEPCTVANREAARHRSREKAYGRWEAYIDAEPARAHVRRLGAQGMGWKRVARAAGLSPSTVWKLVYGDRTRFDGPSKRVRRHTAEAILGVRLDLADGANIDATGTKRRIQALVCLGHSVSSLAERLGWQPSNFHRLVHEATQVEVRTARAVAELYDKLSMTPAAGGHWQRKGAVTRAKNYAASFGWLPPLAWDDETIDDPFAQPEIHVDVSRLSAEVDEVAVQRFIERDLPLRALTLADRTELVRRWHELGRPMRELEQRGLNPYRYIEDGAA